MAIFNTFVYQRVAYSMKSPTARVAQVLLDK